MGCVPVIGRLASGEDGVTLIELLVGFAIGLVVLVTILTVVDVTSQGSQRVAGQVEANQRIRPVVRSIIDDLHSSCVSTRVTPIQPGSTGDSISYLHGRGSDVTVTPELRTLTLSGGTLTRTTYPAIGGTGPDWTFSSTPSQERIMLTDVRPAQVGEPPVSVPAFRYNAYVNGEISGTPLATPLSAADAARAVQVTVSLAASTISTGARRPAPPTSVSDSVTLRFTPAQEGAGVENVPCS